MIAQGEHSSKSFTSVNLVIILSLDMDAIIMFPFYINKLRHREELYPSSQVPELVLLVAELW